MTAYSIAYGFKSFPNLRIFMEIVDVVFVFEICQNFLTGFIEPVTFKMTYSLKKIAVNYVFTTRQFITHALCAFPYWSLTASQDDPDEQVLRNLLIFKMLRFSRLSTDFIPEDFIFHIF